MKHLYKYIYFTAAGLLLFSCKREVAIPVTSRGAADFTRYIAVGNSLSAGYADGGLYLAGQQTSFPAIIAQQLQKVGGGPFTQSLFSTSQANGSGYLKLTGFAADGSPVTANVTDHLAIRGQTKLPGGGSTNLYTKYSGDLNNYAVPGIKLKNVYDQAYGNYNGYFERLLPNDAPNNKTSYMDFVTAKPYTFFTDWLGDNDALLYATSGGETDTLTNKLIFDQLYTASLAQLTLAGQKGAVATIPDVTAIPYFNTVTVAGIMATVKKATPTFTGSLYVTARTTADPNIIAYAGRPATAKDLFILTFPASMIGQLVSTPYGKLPYGLTQYTPVDKKYVLDQNEVALTRDCITSYNITIKATAAAKNLAVFDAYTFLNDVNANGLTENGVTVTSKYITGGLFSLDGVHLTPRGYAILANEFIKVINAKYSSSIPLVNISGYDGVKLP